MPSSRDVPAAAFELAVRYELCFAGAACLQFWLHNAGDVAAHVPEPGDPGAPRTVDASATALWRDALWLEAALRHVVGRLGLDPAAGGASVHDRLADAVASHPWPAAFSVLTAIAGAGPR